MGVVVEEVAVVVGVGGVGAPCEGVPDERAGVWWGVLGCGGGRLASGTPEASGFEVVVAAVFGGEVGWVGRAGGPGVVVVEVAVGG